MSTTINMKRYCVYNDVMGEWDVSVPIIWSGIKKALLESLGSYQTELEATNAVKAFFIAVNVNSGFGAVMMGRSKAYEQTIKALRIRVDSLVASLKRERKAKVPSERTPSPTIKNSNSNDDWCGLNQQSDWGSSYGLGGYLNAVNGFDT